MPGSMRMAKAGNMRRSSMAARAKAMARESRSTTGKSCDGSSRRLHRLGGVRAKPEAGRSQCLWQDGGCQVWQGRTRRFRQGFSHASGSVPHANAAAAGLPRADEALMAAEGRRPHVSSLLALFAQCKAASREPMQRRLRRTFGALARGGFMCLRYCSLGGLGGAADIVMARAALDGQNLLRLRAALDMRLTGGVHRPRDPQAAQGNLLPRPARSICAKMARSCRRQRLLRARVSPPAGATGLDFRPKC